MKQEFDEYEHRIQHLKNVELELNTLVNPKWRELFYKEITVIESKLKDLKKVLTKVLLREYKTDT